MDTGEQALQRIVAQKKKNPRPTAIKLGDVVGKMVTNRILPQQARIGQIVEALHQLLGPDLSSHCRVDSVSAGQLKILVDSPSYRNELRLCSGELVDQLRQQCPQAGIKKIKIGLG